MTIEEEFRDFKRIKPICVKSITEQEPRKITRYDIIDEIRNLLSELRNEDSVSYLTQNDVKWLNECIKFLKQDPIINKIRAEVMLLDYDTSGILEIIDKYKSERSNKE